MPSWVGFFDCTPHTDLTYNIQFSKPATTAAKAPTPPTAASPANRITVLFIFDTDFGPSLQVCEEMEAALAVRLETGTPPLLVNFLRLGFMGMPEKFHLDFSSYDKVVVLLRKAERFRIYREGKILERLEELAGEKLVPVVFELVTYALPEGGDFATVRHDGLPLAYFSYSEKKLVRTAINDGTVKEISDRIRS